MVQVAQVKQVARVGRGAISGHSSAGLDLGRLGWCTDRLLRTSAKGYFFRVLRGDPGEGSLTTLSMNFA